MGFTIGWFAQALAGVDRFSNDQFTRYGFGPGQIAAVRQTMALVECRAVGPSRVSPTTRQSGGPSGTNNEARIDLNVDPLDRQASTHYLLRLLVGQTSPA